MIDLTHDARIAARSVLDAAAGLLHPTLRLGVTGLSRAGKTVFITALAQALLANARLPLLHASSEGRIMGARIAPQPDDAVPRFAVEDHLADLMAGEARRWPQSTRRIAELRLVIDYQSKGFWGRRMGPSTLTLDIVDYPGEWLLDLGLMGKTYAQWSAESVQLAASRGEIAAEWLAAARASDAAGRENEMEARRLADLFTTYLRTARAARHALSALPPGRFLMPGDLEGSPALTFAPLDIAPDAVAPRGSLHAMMERRYDAYVAQVVKPFFREHFSRLDRQVVLVDVLTALDAGPDAVRDLETALSDVLLAFRHGRNSILSNILRPRVDKLLFAATKADHLHHTSHDRLEAILARLVERASRRAGEAGAQVATMALSAWRATREGTVPSPDGPLPVIVGTPEAGEQIGTDMFDGLRETAFFPGDLPADPERALSAGGFRGRLAGADADLRFVRFRPPHVSVEPSGGRVPHIRFDRALEFLIGDALA